MKTYLVLFASIFMAELGDKTVLAVMIGSQLERWVVSAQLKLGAGLVFIGIGAWMVLTR